MWNKLYISQTKCQTFLSSVWFYRYTHCDFPPFCVHRRLVKWQYLSATSSATYPVSNRRLYLLERELLKKNQLYWTQNSSREKVPLYLISWLYTLIYNNNNAERCSRFISPEKFEITQPGVASSSSILTNYLIKEARGRTQEKDWMIRFCVRLARGH